MGTRPPPGRCPGRAQKYRPRARPRRDGDCPECRGHAGLSTPQEHREATDPIPSGKTGARLGRGLGHPGAQPRLPAASMGSAPPRSIRRIPAGLGARGPAPGSPERPRRAPPAEGTHLRRRRHPALARLGPPRTPARASPAAAAGEGAGPAPANQGRPSDARGQSAPCRPGRVGPTETFQRDPSASPGSSRPPPGAAPQWTFPPRLSHGRLYHRGARRGDLRRGACQSRGRKETSNQWEAAAPGPRAVG